MKDLIRAARFVRLHRGKILVIKVGGACLARPALRKQLAEQIAVVEACGAHPVLVHGGGPQTDELQRSFGEEPRMVEGRRVTSEKAMRALRLATLGELNSDLAAAITLAGAHAVGMSGSSLVHATRRPPVVTSEGKVDFGQVGDVASVQTLPILALLEAGSVPVICPPASDGKGGFLNVNADLMAAHLALALEAEKLVLCTNAPGILTDSGDAGSVISTLSLQQLKALDEDGSLRAGMRVKAVAARLALENGVSRVHVVSGVEKDALLGELYTTQGTGTLLTVEPEQAPTLAEEIVS
jgi:acetylglutamate kinase